MKAQNIPGDNDLTYEFLETLYLFNRIQDFYTTVDYCVIIVVIFILTTGFNFNLLNVLKQTKTFKSYSYSYMYNCIENSK